MFTASTYKRYISKFYLFFDITRTRRVQPNLTVAPDESMVNYLRHLLGNPQAVWTE